MFQILNHQQLSPLLVLLAEGKRISRCFRCNFSSSKRWWGGRRYWIVFARVFFCSPCFLLFSWWIYTTQLPLNPIVHSLEQTEIWLQSQSCGQIAELFRWRWRWWRPWSWLVKIWQFSNIYLKLETKVGAFCFIVIFCIHRFELELPRGFQDSRIRTRIGSEQSWWWILWRWWLTIFPQLPQLPDLASLNKWLQLQWILSRKVFQDTSDPFFNWSSWS